MNEYCKKVSDGTDSLFHITFQRTFTRNIPLSSLINKAMTSAFRQLISLETRITTFTLRRRRETQ